MFNPEEVVPRLNLEEGMKIQYIGFAAHPSFRGADVYSLFTKILEAMGYSQEFVPIEKAVK